MLEKEFEIYTKHIVLPKKGSHKGENGRVLVIGGSKLFHAAAFWAASAAGKIVDLVHFTSPAIENNDLMRIRAKSKFWDGIVVPWEDVDRYIDEDDAILIGPGMPRDEGLMLGEKRTADIVNTLLHAHPTKRWVVDGGALQEADPSLFNSGMIITPNKRELNLLAQKFDITIQRNHDDIRNAATKMGGVTILAKGQADIVSNGDEVMEITGGTGGMTKGGTGDVLAGVVTGLYAKSPAMAAASIASRANKRAGEKLFDTVGPYFSAGDLAAEIPRILRAFLV